MVILDKNIVTNHRWPFLVFILVGFEICVFSLWIRPNVRCRFFAWWSWYGFYCLFMFSSQQFRWVTLIWFDPITANVSHWSLISSDSKIICLLVGSGNVSYQGPFFHTIGVWVFTIPPLSRIQGTLLALIWDSLIIIHLKLAGWTPFICFHSK